MKHTRKLQNRKERIRLAKHKARIKRARIKKEDDPKVEESNGNINLGKSEWQNLSGQIISIEN